MTCRTLGLNGSTSDFTVALPLNSSGMYRGVIKADGSPKVAIFDDEELE